MNNLSTDSSDEFDLRNNNISSSPLLRQMTSKPSLDSTFPILFWVIPKDLFVSVAVRRIDYLPVVSGNILPVPYNREYPFR